MSNYHVKLDFIKTDGATLRSVVYPFDTIEEMEEFKKGIDWFHTEIVNSKENNLIETVPLVQTSKA